MGKSVSVTSSVRLPINDSVGNNEGSGKGRDLGTLEGTGLHSSDDVLGPNTASWYGLSRPAPNLSLRYSNEVVAEDPRGRNRDKDCVYLNETP